ncbi:hypothetical protein [Halorhabdus sp. CUG00001]|uniref:DUF7289 family protein n=1 Tax=Halorhabdus sp. CUG00001 TaxID=2600297 RepID=UPI00131CEFC9|nr:hypothetical protein [Halorhabdus sp. CUG00001]
MIDPGSGERAQSEALGTVLLLGLIVSGVAILGVVGTTALNDTQKQVGTERAINSMTLFDSRAALVGLGDADTQSVTFGTGAGSYEVRPDAGRITVTHYNYSKEKRTETMYNESLGALVFMSGETEIAYQGGGVWRRGANGGSLLLSPPEFHYRSATLTLPIVRLANTDIDAASGGPRAVVRPGERARNVFPNSSGTPDGSSEIGAPYDPNAAGNELPYDNPIRNGTVRITVESRYYLGWARYFNQRTDGDIEIYKNNQSVQLTLETVGGSVGDFAMPLDGNSLSVQGIASTHPVTDFELTLNPDGHYGNMHWSLYADEGDEGFEAHFQSSNPGKCKSGSFDGELRLSVYYFNDTGSDYTHEEWRNETIDPNTNADVSVSCPSGELTVDLLGDVTMTYDDIEAMPGVSGSSNKWYFGSQITSESITGPTKTLDVHGVDPGQRDVGETAKLGFLVTHYMGLLGPQYDLTVTDGPGGSSRVDESTSTGTLSFGSTTSAEYLTYLHITENEIDIELD